MIEELTSFLEDELRAMAYELRPGVEILGKRTGHLPDRFGYEPDMLGDALAAFAGLRRERHEPSADARDRPQATRPLPRLPHRGAYLAARTVFGEEGIYFNDIGCYTLGYGPPLETVDALLSMGSSIAMASSAGRVLGRKTLAFIGDSTFFHSGMPALLNAAEAGRRHRRGRAGQPRDRHDRAPAESHDTPERRRRSGQDETLSGGGGPGPGHCQRPRPSIRTTSSRRSRRSSRRNAEHGPSVVVARRDCPIVSFREEGASPQRRRYVVDSERCRHCGHESESLHCGQGPVKEYQRAMVLRRILDQGEAS